MPRCLEWEVVVVGFDAGTSSPDGGTSSSTSGLVAGTEESDQATSPGPTEPPMEVPAPPAAITKRVCKHFGYADEGGCSATGGVPAAGLALAALALLLRRPRRRAN